MRTNPHVLEVNARNWIKRIQLLTGNNAITLANVPESYLLDFKARGFDGLWLMGVWKESLASREIARNDKGINNSIAQIKPDYKKEEILGSQYSISAYETDAFLGGDGALQKFRERLNDLGINLILDFAANHFAIDHPLTLTEPEIFVRSKGEPQDKSLFFQTKNGDWLAHGRDPYFPPWTDTVQINHFNPKARAYLTGELQRVSQMCDGLRCDMVMLMLNKVFKDTWGRYVQEETPREEFWPDAIEAVRREQPFFVFGAEVYWGLEWEVQELGFDFTYDKILYDRLLKSNAQDIQGHLNAEHLYQMRSIRFISNHDEEEPVTAFGPQKSMAAAVIISTIPGLRLFTARQLRGEKRRLPIQYFTGEFVEDKACEAFYKTLLEAVDHPCFHGGQWVLKNTKPINDTDESYRNILAWHWTQLTTCKTVVINYSDRPSRCILRVDKLPEGKNIFIKEELTKSHINLPLSEVKANGLTLEFKPFESKILSVDF
ncbi:MAG: alpha-amylase [Elusimicrobiota bacterium]|jgi:hypothetical protein|nr:alpha-amylase [Elusimicrobiota bacterium]